MPSKVVNVFVGLAVFFAIFLLVQLGIYFYPKYFKPITVTSNVSGYTIQASDNDTLDGLIQKTDFGSSSQKRFYNYEEAKWQEYSNVVINFTNVPQRHGVVVGGDQMVPISSFGQALKANTLYIYVYINPVYFTDEKTFTEVSDDALIRALFLSKNPEYYDDDKVKSEMDALISEYQTSSIMILKISSSQSSIYRSFMSFVEKNNIFKIKKALAQSCYGDYECGTVTVVKTCSNSGASCTAGCNVWVNATCGYCRCSNACTSPGAAQSCGGTSYAACSTSRCATSGSCQYSNGCAWDSGSSTPAPTTPPGPGTIDCGTQTCNSSTEVCCPTGCKPISEGCSSPPASTPTPTPVPVYTCTVQGYKVVMPGNQTIEPAGSQTVSLNDPVSSTATQPYFLTYQSANKTRTVSVSVPANYTVGYTLCYNSTSCHTSAPVMANSVNLPDSSFCGTGNGYADLWWHYYPPPVANCKNLTGTTSLYVGDTATFTATYENGTGPVTTEGLAIYPEGQCEPNTPAYWNQIFEPPGSYSFNWVPSSVGTYDVDCRAWNDGITECRGRCFFGTHPIYQCAGPNTTMKVNVLAPALAWWQVKDSDILANGDIRSNVPTSLYFNLAGSGGFPGVPVYSGTTNLTSTNVSTTKWLARTSYTANKVFGSAYFINKIPSGATINNVSATSVPGSFFESGGTAYNGYYWYVYDGAANGGIDLTISSAASLGSRKIILIVKNASLNISGNIGLTKGSGFFLGVASGNINVNPSVGGGGSANLQGIYIADGTFNTGTGGTKTDSQLWLRGTVAGYGGVNLQRDLGNATNATTPAEFLEYAPDQELLFPIELASQVTNWREIAP